MGAQAHFKTGGGDKSTDTDVATVMHSSLLEVFALSSGAGGRWFYWSQPFAFHNGMGWFSPWTFEAEKIQVEVAACRISVPFIVNDYMMRKDQILNGNRRGCHQSRLQLYKFIKPELRTLNSLKILLPKNHHFWRKLWWRENFPWISE